MATNFPLGPGKIFTILVINKLNFDKIHLINIRVYIMRDFGIVLAKIVMLFGKRKVCITNTHTNKYIIYHHTRETISTPIEYSCTFDFCYYYTHTHSSFELSCTILLSIGNSFNFHYIKVHLYIF